MLIVCKLDSHILRQQLPKGLYRACGYILSLMGSGTVTSTVQALAQEAEV